MKNLELFRKNIKWVLALLALIGICQYSSANEFYLQGNVWTSGVKLNYKTTNTYMVRMDGLNAGWDYSFKVHETWVGGDTWWGKYDNWSDISCSTTDYGGLVNGSGNVDVHFQCNEGGNYFFQFYSDNHKITIWKADPAGGFDNGNEKGVNVSVYKNGESTGTAIYKHGSGNWGQGNQFNAVRTFFIGDASAYYYQTSSDWNCQGYYDLCGCTLFWQVRDMSDNQVKKSGDYNLTKEDPSWSECNGHGKYANGSMGIDVESGLAPGKYHLEWWFKMKGGPGTGNCNEEKYYKYDDKDNFWVGFTAPGFVASNYNLGTKTRGGDPKTYNYGFSAFGWTSAKAEILSGGSSAITFSDGTIAQKSVSITSSDRGDIVLKFDPSKGNIGLNTATLRLSETLDGQTYTKDVTITGTINADHSAVVYIADTAHVAAGPEVTLQGYVKFTGCIDDISRYGFVYGEDCSQLTYDEYTDVTTPVVQSTVFSKTINKNLEAGRTYWYKAYVENANSGKVKVLSEECGTFTTREGCTYPTGETIYYTIDDDADESECSLVFNTIEAAFANLKTHNNPSAADYWWDSTDKLLQKHIVFSVMPKKTKGGYGTPGERVDLSEINYFNPSKSTTPSKEFILRSGVSGLQPIINGLNLADSRNVTIDGVRISRNSPSDGDGIGHACILIGRNVDTNNLAVGQVANSNLKFVNCIIEGDAFCCIHGQGINGLYMENNDLIANCSNSSNDTKNWGASIKLMNSMNVVMLRNNFKGSHSNNIFAQNVRNILIMNNVFWNDNKLFETGSGDNNSAVIRLVNYGDNDHPAQDEAHKVKNIGMYYNTMYLADGDNTEKVDFLIFGGAKQGQTATWYEASTIDFKYNNCYSYSTKSNGKTSNPFIGLSLSGATTNNFWAAKDGANFSFGSDLKNVNMSTTGGMVCQTASFTPEGLIIKGSDLNLGSHLTSDVAGVIILSKKYAAENYYNDRNNDTKVRPNASTGWTLGAYQQAVGGTVSKIIWNGLADTNWDNRNNWIKIDENGVKSLVTCVDDLADDLEVIIPEPYSTKYPSLKGDTIKRYPVIPAWSTPTNAELVRAGLKGGTEESVTKFAQKINIEYGGTIKGVENLGAAEHYTGTEGQLTTDRKEWVLVGTVVKPFKNGESGEVRNIISRDYYIENHMPHVYMNQIGESGGNINFGVPFTSLEEEVPANKAFAIQVADQYGASKLPASYYFVLMEPDPSRVGDGTKPHTYQFVGRFANDEDLPTLNLVEGYNFLNNSYPSVLDASKLDAALGSGYYIKLYSYTDGAWDDYKNVPEYDRMIKPQSGFVIVAPAGGGTKTLEQSMYDGSYSGKYKPALKSVDAESGLVLRAYNTVNNKGSNVGIWYNYKDIEKAFNTSVTDNAELYIIKGDGKYSTVTMADVSEVIPLGIRNKSTAPFTVKFEVTNSEGIESAVLEDRGVEPVAYYDLLDESTNAFFQHIMPGDTEGRFFLNLNYADDDDIPTDDDDVTTSNADIDLYGDGNSIIISSSENVILKSAEITDMSGRTTVVTLKNAHYNKINVMGAQGVYVVKAIGDTKTETAKVIVK